MNQFFNYCNMGENEATHLIDENGGVLGSVEERSVSGIPEVSSVLLIRLFVQSLFATNEIAVIKKTLMCCNKTHTSVL